jgi:hypothetical protein
MRTRRLYGIELGRHFAGVLIRAEVTSAIVRCAEDSIVPRMLLDDFTHDLAEQVDFLGLDDGLVHDAVEMCEIATAIAPSQHLPQS